MDLIVWDASEARQEGRYADALTSLERQFDQIDRGERPLRGNHFVTMFEWSMLVGPYLPAHQAMVRVRDEQVRRLRDGHEHFGDSSEGRPRSRFYVIVEMNDILNDMRSTYDVFVHLTSAFPSLARVEAHLALPAIVEVGDFALAEAYLDNPLPHLAELNRLSSGLPLFPPAGAAPRLAAELSNFMKAVVLRGAVLQGLGRESEAEYLRHAALNGLATDEMRELGKGEIAVPGSIIQEITSRSMATLPPEGR